MDASGAMLLLNSIQVAESISGSVVPLANVFGHVEIFQGEDVAFLKVAMLRRGFQIF